jgi:hypothetical protein
MKKLSLILLFLLWPVWGFTTDYYVDHTGGGGSTCLVDSACATVEYVLDNKAGAGDTIYVQDTLTTTGNNGATLDHTTNHDNITITQWAGQPAAKWVFTDGPTGTNRFDIKDGVSGVTISNIEIECSNTANSSGSSPCIAIRESGNTIDGVTMYNGQNGIMIQNANTITIKNSTIYGFGAYDPGYPDHCSGAAGAGSCITHYSNPSDQADSWSKKNLYDSNTIYNCGEHAIGQANQTELAWKFLDISNSTLYDCGENVIDFKGVQFAKVQGNEIYGSCGAGISAANGGPNTSYGIWMSKNQIYNNHWGGIWMKFGNNHKMWNNLVYENCEAPEWDCYGVRTDSGTGHLIEHNVIFANDKTGGESVNTGGVLANNSTDIRNNIIIHNDGGNSPSPEGNIATGSGNTVSHNYVFPTTPGIYGTDAQTTEQTTDNAANFVDLTSPGYDFSLQESGSCSSDNCARNNGTDLTGDADYTIDTDYDGNARDASPDLGAYEYQAGSTGNVIGVSINP